VTIVAGFPVRDVAYTRAVATVVVESCVVVVKARLEKVRVVVDGVVVEMTVLNEVVVLEVEVSDVVVTVV
jgi:hypothetical protein